MGAFGGGSGGDVGGGIGGESGGKIGRTTSLGGQFVKNDCPEFAVSLFFGSYFTWAERQKQNNFPPDFFIKKKPYGILQRASHVVASVTKPYPI